MNAFPSDVSQKTLELVMRVLETCQEIQLGLSRRFDDFEANVSGAVVGNLTDIKNAVEQGFAEVRESERAQNVEIASIRSEIESLKARVDTLEKASHGR